MASVDIAVPCYQYGRFLRDCVGSVLNQGIVDVRVLVIDNASTDNTMRVARDLAIEDARVEVVTHRTNLGHHASFNEGIDWAAADYFMVLCADDLLAPGSLARAISVMEQNPDVHLTYGRALFASANEAIATIDRNGTDGTWRVFAGSELLERFCRTGRCHVPGATALVRTSTQKQVGYYRPELSHTDDFEMWMRFARIGKVAETDAIQGILRLHAANRRSSVSDVHELDLHFEAAFESFFSREGASMPHADRLRRTARRSLSDRAYWGGLASLLRGHGRLSVELLTFAFVRYPARMLVPPVSYLFQRGDAFAHIGQVLCEAAARKRGQFRQPRIT